MEKSKPNGKKTSWLTWLLIAMPVLFISTCNYYLNIHQENAILETPEPGDYFVFSGLIGENDQPFKVKRITNDTMEFYIPKFEFINFESNKSESKVYELDRKDELFDSDLTIKISRSTVDSLRKNSDLSVRINSSPKVYLKSVFGRVRENMVENTLTKAVGQGGTNK